MINLPYNATTMSQGIPYQNVPVQTSQYNFQPTYQQRQTNTQQMQTTSCDPCSGVPQGTHFLPQFRHYIKHYTIR